MAEQELLALVKRLEAVASKLEGSAPGSDTSGKCKKNYCLKLNRCISTSRYIIIPRFQNYEGKKVAWVKCLMF